MSEEKVELEFMTKAKFAKIIDSIVIEKKLSYMDAVIHACEQYGIELEDSRRYVSTVIKSKLEAEAMKLNFLERSAELPFD